MVTAASGEEAVGFLCDCGVLPDVLLLDAYYSPAQLTGFEVLSALRRVGVTSEKLPVIMMSTRNNAQHVEQALASGANACIHKPATSAEIDQRIKWVMNAAAQKARAQHQQEEDAEEDEEPDDSFVPASRVAANNAAAKAQSHKPGK